MEQYFVHFNNQKPDMGDVSRIVLEALTEKSTIHVSGTHEGVDISYNLTVYSCHHRRLGPRAILKFTGFTVPNEESYSAEFLENEENNPIKLTIE